jgi:hypothetical protein
MRRKGCLLLDSDDLSSFSHWETCLPVLNRGRVRALQNQNATPSKPHVFRADFQTFVLIFPDQGGVMIEQAWGENLSGLE